MSEPRPNHDAGGATGAGANADARPLRIGYVRYFNTLPLVQGLEHWRDVSLHPAAPSALGDSLLRGDVDLALCSLVDAARAGGALTLVPAGMIGCDGHTLTVRLLSRVPMASVSEIHADIESHTSVVLARVLLAGMHGVRPAIIDDDVHARAVNLLARGDSAAWPETMLMIGDKVVTDAPGEAVYPHQLDLGQAWKELTGLPFVYAMWMCRTAQSGDARILGAARVLARQRLRNASRLEWIVERFANERKWPDDLARRYVRDLLRYAPDERAMSGAREFVRQAGDLGLLGESSAFPPVMVLQRDAAEPMTRALEAGTNA
ncbi:MAG: menaquinone biosynthetic enzyme MqnA/MqnD family protein [Phycisphaerales bacterium]